MLRVHAGHAWLSLFILCMGSGHLPRSYNCGAGQHLQGGPKFV